MTAEWTVLRVVVAALLVAGFGSVLAVGLLAVRRRYRQRFRVPAEHQARMAALDAEIAAIRNGGPLSPEMQAGLRRLFEDLDRIDIEDER